MYLSTVFHGFQHTSSFVKLMCNYFVLFDGVLNGIVNYIFCNAHCYYKNTIYVYILILYPANLLTPCVTSHIF